MLKNKYLLASILAPLFFSTSAPVNAFELTQEVRTVSLDAQGNSVVLTREQIKRGKRLFNNACAFCHIGGLTKTNPNVGLDQAALTSANPPRIDITSLVAYLKDPRSFDGIDSIAELHPCTRNADIFPKMRSLTNEDLFAIAGHVLFQLKIGGEKWGGGKIFY